MEAPEHTHFGALEPTPALQVAVSPRAQLTLHIWSSLSLVAEHSDCAVTDGERVPKHIKAIKISACLQVVCRISPPWAYAFISFDKALIFA
jgi:hypothetical protein